MKLAALVPMRHHSQRVPGKNYRPLAVRPLFHYIIETLLAVPEVELLHLQDLRAANPRDDDAVCSHGRRRLLRK